MMTLIAHNLLGVSKRVMTTQYLIHGIVRVIGIAGIDPVRMMDQKLSYDPMLLTMSCLGAGTTD